MKELTQVVLNPTDMLVTRVHDYFTKVNKDRLNTAIASDATFNVGVIESVGNEIPKEWEGKIMYYHSNLGTPIEVKGIGKFELVGLSAKLLVRLDQNKSYY